MKKYICIGVFAALMSATAGAQTQKERTYVTDEYTNINVTPSADVIPKAAKDYYIRLYGGFASTWLNPLKNKTTSEIAEVIGVKVDDKPFRGLNLGWAFGKSIAKDYLFLETGIDVIAGWMNISYDNRNDQVSTLLALADVGIPVNIVFRGRVDNSDICISPYFGPHLKINAGYGGKMADNVCRVGLQVGLNFDFNHFYLGVGWNHDFTSLTAKTNTFTSGLRVHTGVIF
ncbi:MAG: hypothetical protein K2O17_07555 [Bacteroidaceae bacterium]|nr:hypothetical protein [Bacteroidaceae bacterium]